MEWMDVIGRTVHAEVVPTDDASKPFNDLSFALKCASQALSP